MQHHGKVTAFPSWNLPTLFWFYVQDRYLSCSRTILVSQFHPQEAIDTKKVHGYSQIPNRHPTQGFETSVQCGYQVSFRLINFCFRNLDFNHRSCTFFIDFWLFSDTYVRYNKKYLIILIFKLWLLELNQTEGGVSPCADGPKVHKGQKSPS